MGSRQTILIPQNQFVDFIYTTVAAVGLLFTNLSKLATVFDIPYEHPLDDREYPHAIGWLMFVFNPIFLTQGLFLSHS